jgi:endonuclease/exonuclease/phosphatase family metal-dependent hydrolase
MVVLVLLGIVSWRVALHGEPLSCAGPVDGLTWLRSESDRQTLDLWCMSVGPPAIVSAPASSAATSRLIILSWNMHVGGGRLEELIPGVLSRASSEGAALVMLLQEAFRAGGDVPELIPLGIRVPSSIRPRRPVPDIVAIAHQFGLSLAYVPSMRNGPATRLEEREDRGNAVLSTEPLSDILAIELPFGKQRRVAVAATVTPRNSGSVPIRVLTAHFDTNRDRVPQAEALAGHMQWMRALPLIVGADVNARRGFRDRAVIALNQVVAPESCGTGRTIRWPLRLDIPFFFLTGRHDHMFSTLEHVERVCQTLSDAHGSDHLPVMLKLKGN